jgi:cellulose synthase/poly-beta-1,6-N-acetylglucosamine synthase-like glycosyltransferase
VNTLALIIFWTFIVFTLPQLYYVWKYVSVLRPYFVPRSPQPSSFKATIVLCLRGPDPFLIDCIRALLNQDYPHYSIQIIIDSLDDPAWAIVERALHDFNSVVPIKVQPLLSPRSTCSLKCSAILQAIDELAADCEVVAFVDADTIARPNWLSELVEPFADAQVGLTTGGRWYALVGDRWGTLHRYVWNTFTCMSMYLNQIPWGGTLACRTEILRQKETIELLGKSLCEDVPLRSLTLAQGLKIQPIHSLIMINQEEISLPNFLRWAGRQLLFTRLYHPNWAKLAFDIIFTPVLFIITGGLFLAALQNAQWQAAYGFGSGLMLYYLFSTIVPLMAIDYSIRRVAVANGTPIPAVSFRNYAKLLLTIIPIYCSGLATAIAAIFSQHVDWRGVSYDIQSAQNIRLVEYLPYPAIERSSSSKESI